MDDGVAISYKVLASGTQVRSSDGVVVGTVDRVLENPREHIFDGIVIRTARGERFVDAPEIARITERAVTLSITGERSGRAARTGRRRARVPRGPERGPARPALQRRLAPPLASR
jgi:hypothetical protein